MKDKIFKFLVNQTIVNNYLILNIINNIYILFNKEYNLMQKNLFIIYLDI